MEDFFALKKLITPVIRKVLFLLGVGLAVTVGLSRSSMVQEPQATLRYPDVRIMVVIPEVMILTGQVPDPAAETEIIRIFTERRYKVVDQAQIAAIRYTPEMEAILRNPIGPEARQMAAKFGADILIIGEAFSETVSRNDLGWSARARVEARAIVARDGQIITAHGTHASGLDPGELVAGKTALRNAGRTIGEYLLDKVGEYTNGPRPDKLKCPSCDGTGWVMAGRSPSSTIGLAVVPYVGREYTESFTESLANAVSEKLLALPYFGLGGGFNLVDRATWEPIKEEIIMILQGKVKGSSELIQKRRINFICSVEVTKVVVDPGTLITAKTARVSATIKIVALDTTTIEVKRLNSEAKGRTFPEDPDDILIDRAIERLADLALKEVFGESAIKKMRELAAKEGGEENERLSAVAGLSYIYPSTAWRRGSIGEESEPRWFAVQQWQSPAG